jgi:DNA-directed RNA polymerase specialized sigma24 family protein
MTRRLPNYDARAAAILNLRASEGLSIGMIAERLGEPQTFVGNILTRAKARGDARAIGRAIVRKPAHPPEGRARVMRT